MGTNQAQWAPSSAEAIGLEAQISIIALPHDMTDEEFRYWYEPETEFGPDGLSHIVRPARISTEPQHAWPG